MKQDMQNYYKYKKNCLGKLKAHHYNLIINLNLLHNPPSAGFLCPEKTNGGRNYIAKTKN